MSSTRAAAFALLSLALGACAQEAGRSEGFRDPGRPVADAVALHAGGRAPQGALGALDPAFRASAPPVVTFAFGSARLDPAARRAVAEQAEWLRDRPELLVSVTGHADAPGTAAVNLRLGQARAEEVARALIEDGVAPERILRVATRGASEPVIATEGRARPNRRAETTLASIGSPPRPVAPMDGVRAARVYNDWRAADTFIEISTSGSQE